MRRRRSRVSTAVLIAFTLTSAIGAVAHAASTRKPFTMIVTPTSVGAGTTTAFSVTLNNNTGTQMMGSANVTVPSIPGTSFTLISASIASPATATTSGNIAQLRNLNVAPGGSVTATITARAPCAPTTNYPWSVIAKQSNNFSGPPGNNLFWDKPNSQFTTTVTPTCSLDFDSDVTSFSRNPEDAQSGATISSAPNDPTAAPVQVEVQDADGLRITASTAEITLATQANPNGSGDNLQGSKVENAVAGVATFSSIHIDETGIGYTLRATTTTSGIMFGDSSFFNIDNFGTTCPGEAPCPQSTKVTFDDTTGQVISTTGGTGPGVETLSVGRGGELDVLCDSFTEVTDIVAVNVTGGRDFRWTIAFPKTLVTGGANQRRACYVSDMAWTDINGNTVAAGAAGELPLCPDVTQPNPCIESRDPVGNTFVITIFSPAGDPRGKGG